MTTYDTIKKHKLLIISTSSLFLGLCGIFYATRSDSSNKNKISSEQRNSMASINKSNRSQAEEKDILLEKEKINENEPVEPSNSCLTDSLASEITVTPQKTRPCHTSGSSHTLGQQTGTLQAIKTSKPKGKDQPISKANTATPKKQSTLQTPTHSSLSRSHGGSKASLATYQTLKRKNLEYEPTLKNTPNLCKDEWLATINSFSILDADSICSRSVFGVVCDINSEKRKFFRFFVNTDPELDSKLLETLLQTNYNELQAFLQHNITAKNTYMCLNGEIINDRAMIKNLVQKNDYNYTKNKQTKTIMEPSKKIIMHAMDQLLKSEFDRFYFVKTSSSYKIFSIKKLQKEIKLGTIIVAYKKGYASIGEKIVDSVIKTMM